MSQEFLPFLSENRITELKIELDNGTLLKSFQETTNTWLKIFFDDEPFRLTKIPYEPFSLDISSPKPYESEAENVRRVYGNLIHITDSQASDERLWAALCLGPFYSYVQYRWGVDSEQKVRDHFFFNYGPRRSVIRNAMSRLWWIGRFTYDETLSDPFLYSDYLTRHADFVFHILELNLSNNKQLVKVLLQVLLDAESKGLSINTNHLGALTKYYNVLGGSYILDLIPYETLYVKLSQRLEKILVAK